VDIKEAATTGAAAPTDADTTTGGNVARRRVLSVGIAGATASLLPFLGRRADAAGAQPATASTGSGTGTGNTTGDAGASIPPTNGYNATGDSTNVSADTTGTSTEASTGGSGAGTTTTAPPRRPNADDIALLSFAQSVELSIRDLYDVALGGKTFSGATRAALTAIREAHEAYGQSLSGLLGREAPNKRVEELFTSMQKSFSGAAADVATAAQALENTAVATHSDIIGKLVGIDGSSLVASIAIVEARHATYLATLAGAKTLDEELAGGDAKALSPSDYPAK
jgi:hypothetical protein